MVRCMGNPKVNKTGKCEKCMRFPKSVEDENREGKWADWRKMETGCVMFRAVDELLEE